AEQTRAKDLVIRMRHHHHGRGDPGEAAEALRDLVIEMSEAAQELTSALPVEDGIAQPLGDLTKQLHGRAARGRSGSLARNSAAAPRTSLERNEPPDSASPAPEPRHAPVGAAGR